MFDPVFLCVISLFLTILFLLNDILFNDTPFMEIDSFLSYSVS